MNALESLRLEGEGGKAAGRKLVSGRNNKRKGT